MCRLKLFNCETDHELNQVTLGRGEPYENQGLALWDKQYLSKSGWATNILKFQNWGRHTGKGIGKKGSIKKPRKRDFDETHNSGLEKQSKAEVNHY